LVDVVHSDGFADFARGLFDIVGVGQGGGQGFGILELAIVLAEFGYGAVPGPFVPSAIAE